MRIIDERTGEELTAPDLERGYLAIMEWAKPEAYETIDNVQKFALAPEDYETVQIYHEYSAEELREKARAELLEEYEQLKEQFEERLEALFSCDSLADLLKLLQNRQGREQAKRRKELREKLKQRDSDSGNTV